MAALSVTVKLGQRSYSVRLGPLAGLSTHLDSLRFPKDVLLIADKRVWKVLSPATRKRLVSRGRTLVHLVPSGEAAKSVGQWLACSKALSVFDSRMRSPGVLALGGGVTGDLAGFVAATYRRGVPLFMVPTTLLSMVDSSVGGKVAIDLGGVKNRVGAFHQPAGVLIDVKLLSTLPAREYRSGLAEVLKYGAILDRKFFDYLDSQVSALLRRDPAVMVPVIRRCVEIKAGLVARDERDSKGLRAFLNFGHTVGHAVESALMPKLLHGEAVALGMAAEAELAQSLGYMPAGDSIRLVLLLERMGLRTRVKAPLGRVQAALRSDKKFEGGRMRFALAGPLGRCRVEKGVTERMLAVVLKARLGA